MPSNLPDLSHITLPDGSRPFMGVCRKCAGQGETYKYRGLGMATPIGKNTCSPCVGTGRVPLPPERIHEGMLMDALEKTGANAFYIVWLPDIKTWRMTMYCEERLIYAEGPTRLAALCEAVLKACQHGMTLLHYQAEWCRGCGAFRFSDGEWTDAGAIAHYEAKVRDLENEIKRLHQASTTAKGQRADSEAWGRAMNDRREQAETERDRCKQRLREANGLLKSILYHDERGQGVGYAETMQQARAHLAKETPHDPQ